jgi:hypothetical protein
VAAGSGDVFTIWRAGFTSTDTGALAVAPIESVTVTVNAAGPAAVGVPDSTPALLSVSHDGSPAAVQL